VIEALFETMAVKKEVFRGARQARQAARCWPATLVSQHRRDPKVTKRPQDVLGMHFFSPANVMKLCEIVPPTSRAGCADDAVSIARKIAKVPAVVGVCDGFVGNQCSRARQAVEKLLFEGAIGRSSRCRGDEIRPCRWARSR